MALATWAWPFASMLQTLPYLIAVVWVLASAFYDVSVVLQQSLFLCLYFYLSNMLERFLCYYLNVESAIISTFVNSSTLAVLFASLLGLSPLSQSTSTLTSVAVLVYSLFLQLLEPVVMFIEMVQIIRFIFDLGERLRSKVYDSEREGESSFFKVVIIIASTLNFGLSLFATIYICRQESHLFAVLSVIVLAANVILTIASISYEHIIIDPSIMALYTSYLIYLASIESHVLRFEITDTKQASDQNDLLFAMLSRMELTLDALKKGFLSIALQLSPLFWVAFILRIKCLTSFLEGELCKAAFSTDEDDDFYAPFDDDQNSWSHFGNKLVALLGPFMPSRSALVRISVVMGFTSIILQRFSSGALLYFLARYQWLVRAVQTFTAAIFYFFALQTFENSQGDI